MKIKNFKILCLCLLPVLSFAAPNVDKIIQNMQQKFKESKSEKIDFVETYKWKLTGEEASLSGTIWLRGEEQFHVITEDQIIVSDGKTLWTYSKPANRVLIDDLAKSEDALLPNQLLLKYTDDYQGIFIGEEEVSGANCNLIELSARTQDTYIPRVRLWVDQSTDLPVKVEQTDLHGNQTIFENLQIKLDQTLNDEWFQFSIPEDAEVIHMTK